MSFFSLSSKGVSFLFKILLKINASKGLPEFTDWNQDSISAVPTIQMIALGHAAAMGSGSLEVNCCDNYSNRKRSVFHRFRALR